MEKMEENDIPKLIRKTGGFDTMNMDSEFNLDHMVQMHDEATKGARIMIRLIAISMGEFWDHCGETKENQKSSTSHCHGSDKNRTTIWTII